MRDFTEYIQNKSFTHEASSFNPLAPQRIRGHHDTAVYAQTGALVQPNGDVLFRIFAPNAQEVHIQFTSYLYSLENRTLPLKKNEEGFHEAVLPYNEEENGPRDFLVCVDGTPVVIPYISTYFRQSHITNFVEIPDPGMEEALIRSVPHGSVIADVYWSETFRNWQRCLIYTPAEYRTSQKKYPVLYLFNGGSENETTWTYAGKVPEILDNLIAAGKCEPCLVVMNDGMVRLPEDGRSRYKGITGLVLNDCMPYIEREYRVYTDKLHRAIAGNSMGGMQTGFIGFQHPELFGYVGLISGPIRCHDFWTTFEENTHLHWMAEDPKKAEEAYRVLFRSWGDVEYERNPWAKDDDKYLAEYGIDQISGYHYCRYPYCEHEWGTFRRGFRDYVQLIFK